MNITFIIPRPIVAIETVKPLVKKGEKIITRAQIRRKTKMKMGNVTLVKEELIGVDIKKNAIQCSNCKDVIQSIYHYHSVRCSCGKCMIDGGFEKRIRNCSVKWKEIYK